MKKKYSAANVSFLALETSGSLLINGSATKDDIQMTGENVSVEPFHSGFVDDKGNDFATISFD